MVTLSPYQRSLVEKNTGLARHLAMIAWAKNRTQDGDELVSVAYQGLVTAALNFDPARTDIDPDDLENGRAFAGYARQRIAGSLLDWQRKSDFVPKRVRKAYKDLQAIGHGSGTTVQELAAATNVPESAIRIVVAAVESMPVSLDDRPASQNDADESRAQNSNIFIVASEENVEEQTTVSSITQAMATAWAGLPFLQRAAVANKFYFGQSASVGAKAIGCSTADLRKALTEGTATLLGALRAAATHH